MRALIITGALIGALFVASLLVRPPAPPEPEPLHENEPREAPVRIPQGHDWTRRYCRACRETGVGYPEDYEVLPRDPKPACPACLGAVVGHVPPASWLPERGIPHPLGLE